MRRIFSFLILLGFCIAWFFLRNTPSHELAPLYRLVLESQGRHWQSPFILSAWDLQALERVKNQSTSALNLAEIQKAIVALTSSTQQTHAEALLMLANGSDHLVYEKSLALMAQEKALTPDFLNDRAVVRLRLAEIADVPYQELLALQDLEHALLLEPSHAAATHNRAEVYEMLQLGQDVFAEIESNKVSAERRYKQALHNQEPYAQRRFWEQEMLSAFSGMESDFNFLNIGEKLDIQDHFFGDVQLFFSEDWAFERLVKGTNHLKQGRELILNGLLEEAICALDESIQNLQTIAHPLYYKALYHRAECDYRQGQLKVADRKFSDLIRYSLEHDYPHLAAESYWHKSIIAIEKNLIQTSRVHFERGIELFRRIDEKPNIAGMHNYLAETYQYTQEPETAWSFYRKALRTVPELSKPRRLFQIYGMAAYFCQCQGFLKLALAYQSVAIYWARVSGEPHALTYAYIWRSRMHLLLGQNEMAKQDSDLALSVCPADAKRARNLLRIVNAQWLLDQDVEQAIAYLNQAIKADLTDERILDTAELYFTRAQAWQSLGDHVRVNQDLMRGLETYEALADTIESAYIKENFFYEIADQYNLAIRNLWDHGDVGGALDLFERRRARLLIENWYAYKGGLTDQFENIPILGFETWRQQLPQDTTALIYHLEQDRVLVWVAQIDQPLFSNALTVPRAHVEPLLAGLQIAQSDAEERKILMQLGNYFLEPVAGQLAASNEILIVADENLALVPWSALPLNGAPLISQRSVRLQPSMNAFVLAQLHQKKNGPQSRPSLLAFGDPAFDLNQFPELGQLHAAAREVETAGSFFADRAVVLTRQEATLDRFARLAGSFDVMHFAGHTRMHARDPLRSSLVFAKDAASDGRLELGTLFDMDFPCMQLVVLSACQSAGLVEGAGFGSLAHPFLNAGASSVIASLWMVEDVETHYFMTLFYEHLAMVGDVNRAFYLTQRECLVQGMNWRTWAGFQLFGGNTHFAVESG